MTAAYKSIADCTVCSALPQKMNAEESTGHESPEQAKDFPEVQALPVVLVVKQGDAYESSETRILKCPDCGTHYHYSRYEEEPHYPHNYGGRIGLSLRRLDPTSAIDLLEGIAGTGPARLPTPEAKLVREFAEGGSASPPCKIADEKRPAAARAELLEIRAREAELWPAIEKALQSPHGQLRDYAAKALLFHLADDFQCVNDKLLVHVDPEVRLAAATLVLLIGNRDGAVFDVLETPPRVRDAFEAWVKKKSLREKLTDTLLKLALADQGTARVFGYATLGTPSSYHTVPIRHAALGVLSVAVDHGADLRRGLVPLASIPAYKLLKEIADKSSARAAEILALFSVIEKHCLCRPSAMKDVKDLAAHCRTRVAKRTRGR